MVLNFKVNLCKNRRKLYEILLTACSCSMFRKWTFCNHCISFDDTWHFRSSLKQLLIESLIFPQILLLKRRVSVPYVTYVQQNLPFIILEDWPPRCFASTIFLSGDDIKGATEIVHSFEIFAYGRLPLAQCLSWKHIFTSTLRYLTQWSNTTLLNPKDENFSCPVCSIPTL